MSLFARLFRTWFATIDAAEAIARVNEGAVLIGVRSGGEWSKEHPVDAVHIPLESVGRRAGELASTTPVVTICHSGARSAIAARTLAARGYTVASVRGGIGAWERAGGRIVTSHGIRRSEGSAQ
jgi:rhodanese-related sulfurtransferase